VGHLKLHRIRNTGAAHEKGGASQSAALNQGESALRLVSGPWTNVSVEQEGLGIRQLDSAFTFDRSDDFIQVFYPVETLLYKSPRCDHEWWREASTKFEYRSTKQIIIPKSPKMIKKQDTMTKQ
jgi:hypothetical protein